MMIIYGKDEPVIKTRGIHSLKVSFTINIIIAILTFFASIVMFTGFKFMQGKEVVLESTTLGMFRFFTVQSNLLVGIVSLTWAIKEYLILKGKKITLTKKDYLWKLMANTAVGLTFFIVFAYLGPIAKDGIKSLLLNSNLFFHLIIPLLSIICFICLERTNLLRFKDTFYGLIPTFLYQIYGKWSSIT